MRRKWKSILWIFAIICLCGKLSIQASAQEVDLTQTVSDSGDIVVVDISDMVYQSGGYGEPSVNNSIAMYAVNEREQLKAEMLQTIQNEDDSLDVTNYGLTVDDLDELKKIYAEIINEHPEMFYVGESLGYSSYSTGQITRLYIFQDISVTDEEKQAFAEKLEKAMENIDSDMTDVEKALVLHDYLAQNCAYAHDEYLNGTLWDNQYVFSAYGALVEEKAVCQGYALAYSALLRKAGIDNKVCSSQEMNHAWNIILIDGEWYHVDVTWDDPVWNKEGQSNHTFFLLSDAEMLNREHSGWTSSVECVSTKYDESTYWWTAVGSQIYIGDKIYYIEDLERGFQLTEKVGENTTVKYVNNTRWEVWEGNGYWVYSYAFLSSQGEYLYFNDKLNLYAMNLTDGTPQKIYTYEGGDGYIYGAMVYENGTARLNISQSPNMGNDDYIVVDLRVAAPNPAVNYETETISTTEAMEYSVDGGNTWKKCTANMKLADLGWNGTKSVNVSFRIPGSGGRFTSDITVVELKAMAGTTNGKISCFGDASDSITIQLLDESGAMVATTTVAGDSTEYGLGRVEEGNYTMRISKENHISREYKITVGDEAITQDVEIHLTGDVNGDGAINARDKKMLFNHIAGTAELEGYDFAVGDVTGDNVLNARDKKMIYNHIAGTSSLWE